MGKNNTRLMAVFIVSIIAGLLMSFAGGHQGVTLSFDGASRSVSIFALCVGLVFLINWFFYIPAALTKTEKYYDLVGSISYLSVVCVALYLSSNMSARSLLVSALVTIWALRLGVFLSTRVHRVGKDRRFDDIKVAPLRFLIAWTLQALWVVITVACALVVITSHHQVPLDWYALVGVVLWILGFSIEAIADHQKRKFKENLSNNNRFIQSGLWAWSQHPNYFGEIVLWLGVAVIALPVLLSWQWVTLISPCFVYLLLTKGSGIPTLQKKAQLLWGDNPEYMEYVNKTPLLWPKKPL